VKTSHPEPGAIEAPTPPPSAKVKALLAKSLADLPQQAAEEARTLAGLQTTNAELTRQLKNLERAVKDHPLVKPGKPVVDQHAIDRAVTAAVRPWKERVKLLQSKVEYAHKKLVVMVVDGADIVRRELVAAVNTPEVGQVVRHERPERDKGGDSVRSARPSRSTGPAHLSGSSLPKGERIVLTAIAQHEDGVTREQLTVLTGFKRSTRDAYIQRMSGKGLVDVGAKITASQAGLAALGSDFEPLPTGDALREHWLAEGRLPAGQAKILAAVAYAYPASVSRDELDAAIGFARSSRDAYIQRLSARKLVVVSRDGVTMSENLHG